MKNLILLLSLILFFIDVNSQTQTDIPWPTLANTDWPMIKHDPQFTGRSSYNGPQTPTVIWTRDLPNGIFSGPIIGVDGNLYFGSYYSDPWGNVPSDSFFCYSPNGDFNWVYKLGNVKPPASGILVDSSGTIYFGSEDKFFYALNPNGTLKWKYETSGRIRESSIINLDLNGNLYFTTETDELYSLSNTGQKNWSIIYESGFGHRSPAISPSGNTIYIPAVDSNLFALNLDGSIKWKFSCGKLLKAPMIDSDGNIYFIPSELPQHYYSLNEDGTIRWKKRFQNVGNLNIWSIPTIDKFGNTYVIALDSLNPIGRALLSFDYNGNFRWKYVFEDFTDDFFQPLICDNEGTVYVGSTFGYNYFAISSEGELKWKLPLEGINNQVDNTGAIAEDGTLFIGVHSVSQYSGATKTLYAIKDTGSVGVRDNELLLIRYSLEQNYPNPFNPSTKISYSLKDEGYVKLYIYDIKGELISTIVNEKQQAGSYEVDFRSPGNISTGVYIYRLTVLDNSSRPVFSDVKKMVYLK